MNKTQILSEAKKVLKTEIKSIKTISSSFQFLSVVFIIEVPMFVFRFSLIFMPEIGRGIEL